MKFLFGHNNELKTKLKEINIFIEELENNEIKEIKKLENFDKSFSKSQNIAIENIEGNFLIIAGAGAGKTRTLVHRAKNMIDKNFIKPENILMITFTKKATFEMRERLENLEIDLEKLTVTTFHSLCYNILKEDREIFSSEIKLDEEKEDKNFDFEKLIFKVNEKMAESNIFKNNLAQKYKYIMIDEYQDSNELQKQFIKLLVESGSNIMAVGDDCQSIYGFRGSLVENILMFKRDFPNSKIIKFTQNYRSSPEIVNFINELSDNMKLKYNKKLYSDKSNNNFVEIVEVKNLEMEADYVIHRIKKIILDGGLVSDIAVLYRNKIFQKHIENKLKLENIAGVFLSTVHSSKGLEWKNVFVVSALNGVYGKSLEQEKYKIKKDKSYSELELFLKEEEERRVFYVACSRAKENLIITYPKFANTVLGDFGGKSKFLEEINLSKYIFKSF